MKSPEKNLDAFLNHAADSTRTPLFVSGRNQQINFHCPFEKRLPLDSFHFLTIIRLGEQKTKRKYLSHGTSSEKVWQNDSQLWSRSINRVI
jgi:hypothetical protein